MVLTDMYCNDHPELANKKREFAYMGQGEPGYSYSQVRMAIELTNSIMNALGQKVHRHIFATCGIPEAIKNYADDIKNYYSEKVTLHLSLHASNERSLLMPINTVYPLNEVISVVNTIYDINKIKALQNVPDINQEKIYVYCAMQLYLDFINIFLRILSIFGKRRKKFRFKSHS